MAEIKPIIVISKCLGFSPCRYDGQMFKVPLVEKIKPYVEYIPVCPEEEIGLGTPRNTLRLVDTGDIISLFQPATGKDYTEAMNSFSIKFLQSLPIIDGFILKNRSPSCGIKDVKIYNNYESGPVLRKGAGLFSNKVQELFCHKPIEDEGRLTNFAIREHYLTQLFTLTSFRKIKEQPTMKSLVKFHSDNKYLFMAYDQATLKLMGNIVANHDKLPVETVIAKYQSQLVILLKTPLKYTATINVLMHIMGYFSKYLSVQEKKFLLNMFERYRSGTLPLSVPRLLLKSHAIRFEEKYLLNQTFFAPYPEDLMEERS